MGAFATESTENGGVPSYLVAASNHDVGGSILSPENWADTASNAGKFVVSTMARAVASTVNIVPGVANWFGADMSEASTYEWLKGMDDDLGQYYAKNQESVDIFGDVAASFVPGMAGVKLLNWGQKALAMTKAGGAGMNMVRSFGLLPDKYIGFAAEAAKEMAQSPTTFSWISSNVLKSVAAGYAQSALEMGAFEVAAATTMRNSPLYDKWDAHDLAYNAMLGGGIIGGGIMGSISAARTFGAVRKAAVTADLEFMPFKAINAVDAGASPFEKMLTHLDSIKNAPEIIATDANALTKGKLLAERETILWNKVTAAANELTDNPAFAGALVDSLRVSDPAVWDANLMHLKAIGGLKLGSTDLEAETVKLLKQKLPTTTNVALKYLTTQGENIGRISDDAPLVEAFADRFSSPEEVRKAVSNYGFRPGLKAWSVFGAKDSAEVEARMIHLQELKEGTLKSDMLIDSTDLPLLDYAMSKGWKNISVRDSVTGSVSIHPGGEDFLPVLKELKAKVIGQLNTEAELAGAPVNTAEIAAKANVRHSLLAGEENVLDPFSDWQAFQSRMRTAPVTGDEIPNYLKPSNLKLVYDVEPLRDFNGNILSGMVYLKEMQKIRGSEADNIFHHILGEAATHFPQTIPDELLLKANRLGAGSGFFKNANGNPGSLASMAEWIGKNTFSTIQGAEKKISERFSAHAYNARNDSEMAAEMLTTRQLMLNTSEQYVWDAEQMMLRNKKQVDYEGKMAQWDGKGRAPAAPQFLDKEAPVEITIKSQKMADFIADWIAHNDESLTNRYNILAANGHASVDRTGTFYMPNVDTKYFKHFAFVQDTTLTSTGNAGMIWAASPEKLSEMMAKLPPGFRAFTKADTAEYYKARNAYQYSNGMNERYFDDALRRSGAAAPFFPITDAGRIMDDMLEFRRRTDTQILREAVSLKYSKEMDFLKSLGDQYTKVSTSTVGAVSRWAEDAVDNPFANYAKTMLNIAKDDQYPVWGALNRLAETSVSVVAQKVADVWKSAKSIDEVEELNRVLADAGIKTIPYDAGINALANHTAAKPYLSSFVQKANMVLSTLMLRADPLNALNNGLGANVLLGTETRALVRAIQAGDENLAGALAQISTIKVPGVDASILSPAKLVANAYGNWWKNIIGNADAGALREMYKANGWLTRISETIRDVVDNVALKGTETPRELETRMQKAFAGMKSLGDFAEKATGNTFAEEMNRFVAADVARQISDLGVKAGVIDGGMQNAYINTFINRTQGNNIAAQRPLMFRGPVGQAIGLFQTYQFNMLQQMFRHVAEGDGKDAALMLALQSSIYGMNGLPAFSLINQTLVGNAAGNSSHKDIISSVYDAAGKEAGDWLLYGASSNMLGLLHPDLKINMYSRGDINPRHVTVVPTSIADVPVVGALGNFFGAVYNTGKKLGLGGDPMPTILQGIEHAQISRPLAGIAQILEATTDAGKSYSTTTKGNIVMQNDLWSIANMGRLLGGKPLDEAVARDALFRVNAYSSAKSKEINMLGQAIKTATAGGVTPSPQEINAFAEQYAHLGGDQKNFSKFFIRTSMAANTSVANKLADNLNNPFSQYMQKIMGGYDLQDFNNGGR